MSRRRATSRDLAALREVLGYDATTGRFSWIVPPNRRITAGSVAGSADSRGYVEIQALGIRDRAHRLAWLFMTGVMPELEIDHINRDKGDNRWANLREVSGSVNLQNRTSAQKNSSTGLLGVLVSGSRFCARIRVAGRNVHLGSFKSAEAAHAAYLEAKRRLHEGCPA